MDLKLRFQNILVVDDEPDILQSLKRILESSLDRVEVWTAASGPEALAVLHSDTIDLILADYRMPGMNGLQLLSEIQRRSPDTTRILATAYPDLTIALTAIKEAGVETFLIKPFDPAHLLEVVASVLFDRRSQELRRRAYARTFEGMGLKSDGSAPAASTP